MSGLIKSHEAKAELRTQENEKKLMEKNKKLESEKATLIEANLQIEREIAWLEEEDKKNTFWKNKVQQLQDTIAALNNKESENGKLQQQNMTLLKENQELRNKYAIERMWREQREEESENVKRQNEQNLIKIQELLDMLQIERQNLKATHKALNCERLNRQHLSEKVETLKTENCSNKYQVEQMERNVKEAENKAKKLTETKHILSQTESEKQQLAKQLEQCKELIVQHEKKLARREYRVYMLEEIVEELTQEIKILIENSREHKTFKDDKQYSQLKMSKDQPQQDKKAKDLEEKTSETAEQPCQLDDVIQILQDCQWVYSYIVCIRPHGWVHSYLCENTRLQEDSRLKHEERISDEKPKYSCLPPISKSVKSDVKDKSKMQTK